MQQMQSNPVVPQKVGMPMKQMFGKKKKKGKKPSFAATQKSVKKTMGY